ncbi:MAG: hypothetical protein MJ252_09605 [archaeon]|nr:hypothetical protein [archaeon]
MEKKPKKEKSEAKEGPKSLNDPDEAFVNKEILLDQLKESQNSSLYINNFSYNEEGDYTVYNLRGKFSEKEFNRRYNDFFTLRETLTKRWPGIYIPGIPPKKLFGKNDRTTINLRNRTLNKFCGKIANIHYFEESEELKIFLNPNLADTEVSRTLSNLPNYNYQNILNNYEKYFSNYAQSQGEFNDNIYQQFNSYLDSWLKLIKSYKDKMYSFAEERAGYTHNSKDVLDSLEDYEKKTLVEYVNGNTQYLIFFNLLHSKLTEKKISYSRNMINTFAIFYEWMEEKELDLTAMLNCLSSYAGLKRKYQKLNAEIISKQNKRSELEQGKKSIFEKVLGKSSSDLIQKNANELTELLNEAQILEKICTIIEQKFSVEIYPFVDDLKASFYEMIQKFNEAQKNNAVVNKELWEQVVI